MSGPPHAVWTAAIYATRTGPEVLGSAVVIDKRRVLTCAHVIMHNGQPPRRAINAVCAIVAGDRLRLAAACADRTVRIWDAGSRQQIHVLRGHTGIVRDVTAFVHNRRPMFASASADRTVRLWDARTNANVLTIPVHHPALCCTYNETTLVVGLVTGLLGIDLAPLVRPTAAAR